MEIEKLKNNKVLLIILITVGSFLLISAITFFCFSQITNNTKVVEQEKTNVNDPGLIKVIHSVGYPEEMPEQPKLPIDDSSIKQ
ncbi:MAG: hypothetical protein UR69_C0001G0017 [Candidatus Moranbacteria bacterium GW2011_GWE2_35_2-]|nr:MAG: hypothetical protein UR69_C0001G0017 [Candidatus Moranbacteria bacterium GW2011_GWE2_35_2-]KKQ06048.1 MAG: hypothetical protein US15_C0021G0009 [Candidatus Moranbacteria bacterium GW2011_GWF1_36_4]KKQ22985.1 MAG: hypothetical protein US37_C0001G0257 [Candidatus Moranbacteria bacterium GW2011_GWF2_37_11]KKQ29343.1 MAG: hypothetical protein US44_C0002G0125 [Candidatus Moranbacteria bacterium GW2011_GWD1_37_17]KKQ30784.1 MAG: hypothetical protein US47_C0001G0017 [Candidatus Moranbacteria b